MQHGGARKGAGRPKGQGLYGEPTKPIRIPVSQIDSVLQFVAYKGYQLPLYSSKVSAGFPSPADDHIDGKLDLNEHLIKNPTSTFFLRVSGNSMINAGIHENDILIVDRSIKPQSGKIVIAAIDGELTVKRLANHSSGKLYLMPDNPDFEPIEIQASSELIIWGVVTNVVHSL